MAQWLAGGWFLAMSGRRILATGTSLRPRPAEIKRLLVIGRHLAVRTCALVLTITRVRRLTDPIRRLAEAANLIAAGQRSVQVALDARDEIGRLAHSFNDMATSLEQHEAALQQKVQARPADQLSENHQAAARVLTELSGHQNVAPTREAWQRVLGVVKD